MCLYPQSHSKPTILFLRTILCQLLASHNTFCLWSFHSVSVSFNVKGTTRFADNKNHAVANPKLNHIAGIKTPELIIASKICDKASHATSCSNTCKNFFLNDMNPK
jgi:hypothetical protein